MTYQIPFPADMASYLSSVARRLQDGSYIAYDLKTGQYKMYTNDTSAAVLAALY